VIVSAPELSIPTCVVKVIHALLLLLPLLVFWEIAPVVPCPSFLQHLGIFPFPLFEVSCVAFVLVVFL